MTRDTRNRLLIGVLCALAACATPARHWTRPGTTEAEFHRDSFDCAKQSQRFELRTWPRMTAGGGTTTDKALYQSCMRGRGYELVEGGPWIGHRDD
jgi:hypothetical protein